MLIVTSASMLENVFATFVDLNVYASVEYTSGLFSYASCLFMCNLLPATVFRETIQKYQRHLTCPSPLGITEQYAQNLHKYSQGSFRETYIRPFREIVMKQYKKRVPFDYHISYDITDRYIDTTAPMLSFDALIIDYVHESLTLGELSLLSAIVQNSSTASSCAASILPMFLCSNTSSNDNVRKTYRYINAYILQQEHRCVEMDLALRHETCHNQGYKWVADIPYRFAPDMQPHHLQELIAYANDGYVFGNPCHLDLAQTCGIYKTKMKKETECIFDSLR